MSSNSKIKTEYNEKHAELKITVPVDKKVWKDEQRKAFNKLSKTVKVPGFRPGKAPEKEIKKYLSTPKVWEEAISKLLNVVVKDAAKEIDEKKYVVLDSPTYSVEKVTDDELEIIFIYPILPDFKIKDYKNIKVEFKNPTDADLEKSVNKQIDSMLSRGTVLLPKEGADAKVEDGDTIIFDFKGFLDGKEFEGGEAENFELKIGSNAFIPGFEESLIGKPNGWEGSINVKFPADYYKNDLKGKDAEFKIKIHEIKYNDKPALTEEYIKNLKIENVTNEKEFKAYLKDLSRRELIEKQRGTFFDEFSKKIIEENEIPVPRTIVLKEMQALMKKFEENLKNQGINKKEYYEITGYNDEKVKEELMIEAEKSIKKSMLYTFFAKELNIKPSDEDFERQYQRIAKLYSMDIDQVKMMIKKEIIEPQILNELVLDNLITITNPSIKIEKEKIVIKKSENKEKEESK